MADPGGTAQSHPEKDPLPILVAPTTEVSLNTVRAFLIPVGCWRVDDVRFAFDSSVVHPDVKTEMGLLATLRKAHPGAPLSIFGHADPTGDDSYNKTLSGRRATAIYALLVRDVNLWESLYSNPLGGDNWGIKSIQMMLNEVTGTALEIDGIPGSETRGAIEQYQKSKGASPSGTADKSTRAKLFADYMDAVCVDAAGQKYQLQKSEFLAKGADAGGKGDYQGCGEFNPFVVFSKDETKKFASDHATRDSENAPNRRVMALLFKPGTVVSPGRWPCPTVKDGIGGCKARFWSDGEKRRNPQDDRRTFDDTKDTYGCRFYHRLFVLSPCGSGSGQAPAVVMQIKAKLEATKEIRAGSAKKRADATLTPSASPSRSLGDNKPVFLVQGTKDVDLEAVISAPADVTWTVEPNENTNPAPSITPVAGSPNNTKAKLSAAQGGSFSVIASIGASRVVWNVVFVSVKVSLEGVVVDLRNSGYAEGVFSGGTQHPSDNTTTRFTSGRFQKGKYPFEAFIPTIKVVGGGSDGKLGVDQVVLHYLQNGVGDSLTGHYAGGKTASEVVQDAAGKTVTFPVTDSNGDADSVPYADAASMFTVTNPAGDSRSWRGGDAPAAFIPLFHKHGERLQTVTGSNDFRVAVASTSKAAPNSIVVHAELSWKAHFEGTVAASGAGVYTPKGANTSGDSTFTLIAPDSNGKDAADAGFETFEPRYNNGSNTILNP